MMSKEANDTKSPKDTTKKWSFLDTSKRILGEEKSLKNSAGKKIVKDKEEALPSSDNMVEAEPDINQLFKHK
ncbi:hypothetical protein ACTAZI_18370 [Legionella bozemanae]|uniref:hypothetical protein n=1 Tax=Legionella bozemanae TaxID=447 RepID=UPI00399C753C